MNRGAAAVGLALLADAVPSVLAIPAVRRSVAPVWAGVGDPRHIALTFDDGPDPRTTPAMLSELDRWGVRATFFVLGEPLAAFPELGRRLVDEGHEVALHGWSHRPHLVRTPFAVAADICRGYRAVSRIVGSAPRFWRPPHGIPTATGGLVAARLGMRLVLWGVDGREWRAGAEGDEVARRLIAMLRPGATVLLHDSENVARTGTARAARAALAALVAEVAERGWRIGPLAEHGLACAAASPGQAGTER